MTTGKLIIATNHIGDISDVPLKTIHALKNSKYIVCDSRQFFISDVLKPYDISLDDLTLIEFNGKDKSVVKQRALEILNNGEDVVFICDAGTPGFSDYGTDFVGLMHENAIPVQLIPGPSIIAAAIATAGVPGDSESIYYGAFMHCDFTTIEQKLSPLATFCGTLVLIDNPEKMEGLLEIISKSFGPNRLASMCINLTLDDQKIIRGSVTDVLQRYKDLNPQSVFTTLVLEGKYDSVAPSNETLRPSA